MTGQKSFISRNYLIITCTGLFFWLGRGIINPILPLLVRSYGYSMTELGVTSLSRSLGFAVFEPISGWLYDRFEMKKIIIVSSVAGILVMPLYTFSIDLWQFALISFMLGGASAGISSPTRAAIAHIVPEEQRGKAYGIFQSIRISGMMVGPILGGYLAQNINYNIPFYLSSLPIVGTLIFAFVLPKIRETKGVHDSAIQFEEKEKTSYKRILTTGFTTFFIARVLSVLVGFFSMNLLAVYANETLGATETEVGLISTIRTGASMIMGICFGTLATKIGKEKLILLSMLLSGFTYLGFFAVQNIFQLYLIGAILGIERSAYNLGLITLMMDRVPSTHYGSAVGLFGLAEDTGGMLGSIVIGSIYDIWGMPAVLYFLFSDMITNAIVSLIAFKKFHYKNNT